MTTSKTEVDDLVEVVWLEHTPNVPFCTAQNGASEVYRVYDPFSGEHLNVSYEEGTDLVAAGWR